MRSHPLPIVESHGCLQCCSMKHTPEYSRKNSCSFLKSSLRITLKGSSIFDVHPGIPSHDDVCLCLNFFSLPRTAKGLSPAVKPWLWRTNLLLSARKNYSHLVPLGLFPACVPSFIKESVLPSTCKCRITESNMRLLPAYISWHLV